MTTRTANPDAVATVVPWQVWEEIREDVRSGRVEETRDLVSLRLREGAEALDGLPQDVDLWRSAASSRTRHSPTWRRSSRGSPSASDLVGALRRSTRLSDPTGTVGT